MEIPNTAGTRAITIGIALGVVATSLANSSWRRPFILGAGLTDV